MTSINWATAQQFRLAIGAPLAPIACYQRNRASRFFHPVRGTLPAELVERYLATNPAASVGTVVEQAGPLPPGWADRTPVSHPADFIAGKHRRCWGARGADICAVPSLRCDADCDATPNELLRAIARLPRPTVVVATGNRGAHFYWRLRDAVTPAVADALHARLHAALLAAAPAGGWDRAVYSRARVMRLPGTVHPKTSQTVTWDQCGGFYSLDELEQALPPIPSSPADDVFLPRESGSGGGSGWLGRMLVQDRPVALQHLSNMLRAIGRLGPPGSGSYGTCWQPLKALANGVGYADAYDCAVAAGWDPTRTLDILADAQRAPSSHGLGAVVRAARNAGWSLEVAA